jgi:micrococcal nuclease
MKTSLYAIGGLLAALVLAVILTPTVQKHEPKQGASVEITNVSSVLTPTRYGKVKVVRDADGDTIQVINTMNYKYYVRFLEVDTPETHRPGYPIQCGGPEASAFTHAQLPNGSFVTLKPDPKLDQVDRYGRTLAYVYRGTTLFNLTLVRLGYAKAYHYLGQRGIHAVTVDRYQKHAQINKLGIWGPPCNGDTKKPEP